MPSSWSEARFSDLLQQELPHSDPNRNSILPKPFVFPAALCRAVHVSYRSSSSRGCAAVRAGAAVGRQVGPALLTALQRVLLSAQLCVLHHLPWDDSCSAPGSSAPTAPVAARRGRQWENSAVMSFCWQWQFMGWPFLSEHFSQLRFSRCSWKLPSVSQPPHSYKLIPKRSVLPKALRCGRL